MFQVQHVATDAVHTVFGVHKSGPQDAHTKFLVYESGGGWRWAWAHEFEPVQAESAWTQPCPKEYAA